jgi:hypothetical protein
MGGAIVLGELRRESQGLRDMRVVGLVVFAFDGVDVNLMISHQVCRNVVLSGQRIRGTERYFGPSGPQRLHEVGGLGRDMEAGRDLESSERLVLGKARPDLPEYWHGPFGPLGPAPPLVGESQILDVVFGHGSLDGHELLNGRLRAEPSHDPALPR